MRDQLVRAAAFEWLAAQVEIHDDVLPWRVLLEGFRFEGARVPLLSQQGIFKPRVMDFPLSMRTSISGPYDDSMLDADLLRYAYQGDDPSHWQNVGLRECMRSKLPLVYFHGVARGKYLATWPVYVVGDDPNRLYFTVDLSERQIGDGSLAALEIGEGGRRYSVVTARQRLHQRAFRERVLAAYRNQCAICRLRHRRLLDATHIIPDSEEGEPRVKNGLALCKLHHAAFDAFFFGIRPDYQVVVRGEVLDEKDGPMLLHGLQGIHGASIELPRSVDLRPDPELLAQRFERFREAS